MGEAVSNERWLKWLASKLSGEATPLAALRILAAKRRQKEILEIIMRSRKLSIEDGRDILTTYWASKPPTPMTAGGADACFSEAVSRCEVHMRQVADSLMQGLVREADPCIDHRIKEVSGPIVEIHKRVTGALGQLDPVDHVRRAAAGLREPNGIAVVCSRVGFRMNLNARVIEGNGGAPLPLGLLLKFSLRTRLFLFPDCSFWSST